MTRNSLDSQFRAAGFVESDSAWKIETAEGPLWVGDAASDSLPLSGETVGWWDLDGTVRNVSTPEVFLRDWNREA